MGATRGQDREKIGGNPPRNGVFQVCVLLIDVSVCLCRRVGITGYFSTIESPNNWIVHTKNGRDKVQ